MNSANLAQPRGLYFAVEGCDGAGKTTVTPQVGAALGAFLTREPGGSPLSEAVRGVLKTGSGVASKMAEFCLFWGARYELVSEVVLPRLLRGELVGSDRSAASTNAYQIEGRELRVAVPGSEEAFWALYDALPARPSLYLYLEVSYENAVARLQDESRGGERDHFDVVSPEEFARRQFGYERFFERVTALGHADVVRIDANRSRDQIPQVVAEMVAAVKARLPAAP